MWWDLAPPFSKVDKGGFLNVVGFGSTFFKGGFSH